MEKPLWKIEAFKTAAGNAIIQQWFWDELTIEERDKLRDRMIYLTSVGRHLWQEPYFKSFGDIGEVRAKVQRGALRVYGYFPSDKNTFVFLNGVIKKTDKDNQGVDTAEKRLKRLKNGEGDTHGFDFEERTTRETSPRAQDPDANGGIEPL
jgi:Phage derived protein Gp49-like (DUF891)